MNHHDTGPATSQLGGRSTKGAVLRHLELCGLLTRDLTDTLQALAQGEITLDQSLAMAHTTRVLEREDAQRVEAQVLPQLPGRALAASKSEITRATLRLDPEANKKLHTRAMRLRGVKLQPQGDGMAALIITTSAEQATAAYTKLNDDAQKQQRAPGETRELGQLRADLAYAHLTDATPGQARPVAGEILVMIPFDTLAGLSNEPGQIEGAGPISADQARQLAFGEHSTLRTVLTGPDGTPLAADARRYPAATWIKRIGCMMYPTCTYPGCTVPSKDCDWDHYTPFHKGGWTLLLNLAPLCRRHHTMKGHKAVHLERHGYTLIWTLQNGETHTVTPHAYFTIRT